MTVLWHLSIRLHLEENQLMAFALKHPRLNTLKLNDSFRQVRYDIRVCLWILDLLSVYVFSPQEDAIFCLFLVCIFLLDLWLLIGSVLRKLVVLFQARVL